MTDNIENTISKLQKACDDLCFNVSYHAAAKAAADDDVKTAMERVIIAAQKSIALQARIDEMDEKWLKVKNDDMDFVERMLGMLERLESEQEEEKQSRTETSDINAVNHPNKAILNDTLRELKLRIAALEEAVFEDVPVPATKNSEYKEQRNCI